MSQLLAGKVAAITGGVTGIGRAIAIEFLRQGASVTVNHLGDASSHQHFETLQQEVSDKSKLLGVSGDIGLKETGTTLVNSTIEKFGQVNIFVANAGVSQFRDFLT